MTKEFERMFCEAKSKVDCRARHVISELQRDLRKHLEMKTYFPETQIEKEHLIKKAIEANKVLHFIYENQKGEVTNREFTPQEIVNEYYCNSKVYGYCHLKKETRQFIIDNMRCLEIVG